MMIYWQLSIKNYKNKFRACHLIACLQPGVPPLKEEFRADKPLLLDWVTDQSNHNFWLGWLWNYGATLRQHWLLCFGNVDCATALQWSQWGGTAMIDSAWMADFSLNRKYFDIRHKTMYCLINHFGAKIKKYFKGYVFKIYRNFFHFTWNKRFYQVRHFWLL